MFGETAVKMKLEILNTWISINLSDKFFYF